MKDEVLKSVFIVKEVRKKKQWVIIRCDSCPASVGEFAACGMPCRAEDVSIGTMFNTVLTIKS